MDNQTTQSRT